MRSVNVLLILPILAITTAYPAENQYIEYVQPSNPYFNYGVLVNQPYQAPNGFTYEQPKADPSTTYDGLYEFEQIPSAPPQHPKLQTFRYQKEEVKDVVEDVLKLLIDERLCQISNANGSPIIKRSINQQFATKAAPTPETLPFTQQQLAFLKDLKPEDIKALIKLLVPGTPEMAANRTLPLQQELPHLLPPTYESIPVWHPVPLQVRLPPSPHFQNQLLPYNQFGHQIISYEPFKGSDEVQFIIMKPDVQSPAPFTLNNLPPLRSPFVYSVQISAPVLSNQAAAKPPTTVPNSQIISKPLPSKPNADVTSSPEASSIAEKLASIFIQSRILDEEKTTKGPETSTEKNHVDVGTQPSNTVDNVTEVGNQDSSKLKADAAQGKARSATEESGKPVAVQAPENEILEAFKAIREKLRRNACKMTAERRAIHERPNLDSIGNQAYQNYLSRHAVPPTNHPARRHPPARVQYHKYTPHTPLRTTIW